SRNRDDDEAVEMVRGGGELEDGGHSGPIVLEDVPDVSEKHLAVRPETFTTDSVDGVDSVDSVDSVGDIPSHQPSHGTRPRGSDPELDRSRPRPRTSNPPPTGVARDSAPVAMSMEDLFDADDDAAPTLAETRDPPRASTAEPVIRFSRSGKVPIQRALSDSSPPVQSGLEPLRPPPRTRPGVQPAPVRRTAPVSIAPATQKPVIGQSMVERNHRRVWPYVLLLLFLGGGGAGVALYVTSQRHDTPAQPGPVPVAEGPATVKFDVTPADAEIRIDGVAHTGMPWSTRLAAGIHQIEIHRTGFTAYLTSLELAANDKHSLHIELRPLGTASTSTEATLSIASSPSGLEAELDGVALPQHTPLKLQIKVGAHTIVLKRAGVEIWRQTVNAEPASDIELNPSFNAPAALAPAQAPERTVHKQPAIETSTPPEPPPPVTPDASVGQKAAELPAPLPIPEKPVAVVPVPVPPPPPPTPIVPVGPVTVAPNAVSKLSGETPNVSKFRGTTLPPVVAGKLCIDKAGAVTSVDFVGKLDHRIANDLAEQLKTWKYKPYVLQGTPVSACFVVTMRMK
ncbi:MAG: PEGA domain-containing protein, partial [Kofleriaceae bacterium]